MRGAHYGASLCAFCIYVFIDLSCCAQECESSDPNKGCLWELKVSYRRCLCASILLASPSHGGKHQHPTLCEVQRLQIKERNKYSI